MSDECKLCLRKGVELTEHHLIPRTTHRKLFHKKKISREVLNTTVCLCYPCHKNLHSALTEKQLAMEYNSIEKLAEYPAVAKFTSWIRNKPGDLKVRSKKSKR